MPITIAITELQRPPVPSVLSVQDRQVYVDNIDAPPPGYVLTRRWMRNDPDVDVEHLPGTHNALVLPRPLPHDDNINDDPPAFPDDSEHYDPEEAVKSLKQHWVNHCSRHSGPP
ncbi:hypothetical protein OEZ86_009961 [Tetradesmus obliquus]|uniref:Uncharacterized protein n=1 Tax=Tetradesmus obliquus TaxID=3088 RepID=A0ABY8URR4_TETOB|nr:hypothetical protein OEZ85_001395 [Tetradesmus obliquus]WIA43499.1 hypothetical protein OEZ86_009961 [Tetradesmus obliquus]